MKKKINLSSTSNLSDYDLNLIVKNIGNIAKKKSLIAKEIQIKKLKEELENARNKIKKAQ